MIRHHVSSIVALGAVLLVACGDRETDGSGGSGGTPASGGSGGTGDTGSGNDGGTGGAGALGGMGGAGALGGMGGAGALGGMGGMGGSPPTICDGATALAVPGNAAGDTTAATELITGTCQIGAGPDDVYEIVTAQDELVTLSLTSDADLGLVLVGDCNDPPEQLGCVDVALGVAAVETIQFATSANESYHVFVSGYNDAEVGPYTLDATSQPSPCIGATTAMLVGANAGDTTSGTDILQGSCQQAGGAEEAWTYTPTMDGYLEITLTTGTDQGVWVLQNCNPAQELGCADAVVGGSDEVLTVPISAGVPLDIFVGAYTAGEESAYSFTLQELPPPCQGAPTAIVGVNNGDTIGATSLIDGSCQVSGGGDDAWTYTPTIDGLLTIDLASATDQGVYVLQNCDPANEIICRDSFVGGTNEVITFPVSAGVPLDIMIGAYGAGNEGPYSFTVSEASFPCTGAPVAAVGANNGDTTGGTDVYNASCGAGSGLEQAWSYTPTTNGALTITLASVTDQNVWLMTNCDPGTEFGCSESAPGGTDEVLYLPAVAGTPIDIFVGANGAGQEGTYTLTIAEGAASLTCEEVSGPGGDPNACDGTPGDCVCVGCVDDGVCDVNEDDCPCSDCTTDGFCGNPANCNNDGICDAYLEGCVCFDCAEHPQCP